MGQKKLIEEIEGKSISKIWEEQKYPLKKSTTATMYHQFYKKCGDRFASVLNKLKEDVKEEKEKVKRIEGIEKRIKEAEKVSNTILEERIKKLEEIYKELQLEKLPSTMVGQFAAEIEAAKLYLLLSGFNEEKFAETVERIKNKEKLYWPIIDLYFSTDFSTTLNKYILEMKKNIKEEIGKFSVEIRQPSENEKKKLDFVGITIYPDRTLLYENIEEFASEELGIKENVDSEIKRRLHEFLTAMKESGTVYFFVDPESNHYYFVKDGKPTKLACAYTETKIANLNGALNLLDRIFDFIEEKYKNEKINFEEYLQLIEQVPSISLAVMTAINLGLVYPITRLDIREEDKILVLSAVKEKIKFLYSEIYEKFIEESWEEVERFGDLSFFGSLVIAKLDAFSKNEERRRKIISEYKKIGIDIKFNDNEFPIFVPGRGMIIVNLEEPPTILNFFRKKGPITKEDLEQAFKKGIGEYIPTIGRIIILPEIKFKKEELVAEEEENIATAVVDIKKENIEHRWNETIRRGEALDLKDVTDKYKDRFPPLATLKIYSEYQPAILDYFSLRFIKDWKLIGWIGEKIRVDEKKSVIFTGEKEFSLYLPYGYQPIIGVSQDLGYPSNCEVKERTATATFVAQRPFITHPLTITEEYKVLWPAQAAIAPLENLSGDALKLYNSIKEFKSTGNLLQDYRTLKKLTEEFLEKLDDTQKKIVAKYLGSFRVDTISNFEGNSVWGYTGKKGRWEVGIGAVCSGTATITLRLPQSLGTEDKMYKDYYLPSDFKSGYYYVGDERYYIDLEKKEVKKSQAGERIKGYEVVLEDNKYKVYKIQEKELKSWSANIVFSYDKLGRVRYAYDPTLEQHVVEIQPYLRAFDELINEKVLPTWIKIIEGLTNITFSYMKVEKDRISITYSQRLPSLKQTFTIDGIQIIVEAATLELEKKGIDWEFKAFPEFSIDLIPIKGGWRKMNISYRLNELGHQLKGTASFQLRDNIFVTPTFIGWYNSRNNRLEGSLGVGIKWFFPEKRKKE